MKLPWTNLASVGKKFSFPRITEWAIPFCCAPCALRRLWNWQKPSLLNLKTLLPPNLRGRLDANCSAHWCRCRHSQTLAKRGFSNTWKVCKEDSDRWTRSAPARRHGRAEGGTDTSTLPSVSVGSSFGGGGGGGEDVSGSEPCKGYGIIQSVHPLPRMVKIGAHRYAFRHTCAQQEKVAESARGTGGLQTGTREDGSSVSAKEK